MGTNYRVALRATSLQNSVWISPDPLIAEREVLGGGKINVESLILLEARPCAGESDAEMVAGAWDFERINRRHARHLKILEERPGNALRNLKSAICNLKSSEAWAAGPDTAVGLSGATSPQLIFGEK